MKRPYIVLSMGNKFEANFTRDLFIVGPSEFRVMVTYNSIRIVSFLYSSVYIFLLSETTRLPICTLLVINTFEFLLSRSSCLFFFLW